MFLRVLRVRISLALAVNAPGAFALIVGQVQATAPRVTCQVIERQFGFARGQEGL